MPRQRDIIEEHLDLRRRVRKLETEIAVGTQTNVGLTTHLDPVTEHLCIPTGVKIPGGPGRVANILWEVEQGISNTYITAADKPPEEFMGRIRAECDLIPGAGQLGKALSYMQAEDPNERGYLNGWYREAASAGWKTSRNHQDKGPLCHQQIGDYAWPYYRPMYPPTNGIVTTRLDGRMSRNGPHFIGASGAVYTGGNGQANLAPTNQLYPISENAFALTIGGPDNLVKYGNARGPARYYRVGGVDAAGQVIWVLDYTVPKEEIGSDGDMQGYESIADTAPTQTGLPQSVDDYQEDACFATLKSLQHSVYWAGSPIPIVKQFTPWTRKDGGEGNDDIISHFRNDGGVTDRLAAFAAQYPVPVYVTPSFATAQENVDRAIKRLVITARLDGTHPIHKMVKWYKRILAQIDGYDDWTAPTVNYGGWTDHSVYRAAPSSVEGSIPAGSYGVSVSGWERKDDVVNSNAARTGLGLATVEAARPEFYTHNTWRELVLGPPVNPPSAFTYTIEYCLRHGWCHLRGYIHGPYGYYDNGIRFPRTGTTVVGRLPLAARKGVTTLLGSRTQAIIRENGAMPLVGINPTGYLYCDNHPNGYTAYFSKSYPVDALTPAEAADPASYNF